MSTATDELINAYLAELEREAARLPWNARMELLEDVRSHIEVAVAEIREGGADFHPDSLDETAQVRAMLAALGEPTEIVAAALANDPEASIPVEPASPTDPFPTSHPHAATSPEPYNPPTRQSPPYPLDTADISAVALLLLGGLLAGIGWLVGVVLLWTSIRWTRAEKLIGTLILPGGIAGGIFAFSAAQSGTRGECDARGCVTVHEGWNPPGWLAASIVVLILVVPAATTVFLVNRARQRPGINPASRAGLAIIAGVGAVGLLAAVGLVVATSSEAVHSGPNPAPLDYSGSPVSGYAVPVSSPAPVSSSMSAP